MAPAAGPCSKCGVQAAKRGSSEASAPGAAQLLDSVRARAGGLDAVAMSICVPASEQGSGSKTAYPNIIAEMVRGGYSDQDIAKILGINLLRVWEQVESTASL